MRLGRGFLLGFAVMTIVACVSVQGLAQVLLDVDFEDVAIGALPEGFQVVRGTPGVTDEVNGVSGIKTLRIAPVERATVGDHVVCAFPSQGDGVVIEFSFYYKDAGSGARYLCFGAYLDLKAARDLTIAAGPYLVVEGGKMRYFDGAFHDIAMVAPEVWYKVRLVVDIHAQKWDIYVDDMSLPKVTGARFRNPTSEISALAFAVYHPNIKAGTSYVDNIRVLSGELAALSIEI